MNEFEFTGNKDTDREVLRYVEDEELLKVCSVNKRMWNSICDDAFLRRRLRKYANIEQCKGDESWKRFFSKAVFYIIKLKNLEYKYISGNFVSQWILLSSSQTYSNILVRAARSGSLEIIIYCLNKGADLHYNDDHALQKHALSDTYIL